MPDFSSNWKLTFNPGTTGLVIVTHGQRIVGELPAPWRQRVDSPAEVDGSDTTCNAVLLRRTGVSALLTGKAERGTHP